MTLNEPKGNYWMKGLLICCVPLLLNLGFSLIWRDKLPPQLPWLYSQPWGEEQLISKNLFYLGVVAVLVVSTLLMLLAKKFQKRDEVLTQVIVGGAVLITGLYLISYWKVVLITIK